MPKCSCQLMTMVFGSPHHDSERPLQKPAAPSSMESNLICEIAGRGRCVVSNRTYSPGDLVQCEEPYAMIVAEPYATVACSYCCTLCIDGTMYALSSESSVRYCSEKCITADYPTHAHESQAVAALEKAQIQGRGKDSMRLLFRIACCRKSEELSSSLHSLTQNKVTLPLNGRQNTFQHALLLEANARSVTPESARDVSRTSVELSNIARTSNLNLSAIEARSLLYSIQCNAHQIVNARKGLKAVALGLFPLTSMMNHSCSPNCIHRFLIEPGRPPRLIMRAIEHIQKGTELCYSYVNLYQSTTARQSQLSAAYSFICVCERCLPGKTESSGESSDHEKTFGAKNFFSSDADIDMLEQFSFDETCRFKGIEEIEESITSAANAAINAVDLEIGILQNTLLELLNILHSSDILAMHPAHRLLFLCYHTYFLSAVHVAVRSNQDTRVESDGNYNSVKILRGIIGYGFLALGCMKKYVRKFQTEIGHLEGRIALAIRLLLQQLSVGDTIEANDLGCIDRDEAIKDNEIHFDECNNTEELFTDGAVDRNCIEQSVTSGVPTSAFHSPHTINCHVVSNLFLSCGYLDLFPWALKKDQRLIELLDGACLLKLGVLRTKISLDSSSSQSDAYYSTVVSLPFDHEGNGGARVQEFCTPICASSDNLRDTVQEGLLEKDTERNILQNLLVILDDSSAATNFICRAEE